MTRWIVLLVFVVSALHASAQQLTPEEKEREKKFQEKAGAAVDTTKPFGWTHSVIAGANLTQASFTNWVGGGNNALSYSLLLDGGSTQNLQLTNWSNMLKLAFGQSRVAGQGLRKTDDEIYFESLLIYKLGTYINPYASVTARTQFAKGYKYDALGNGTEISGFLDPGFFTQSVGAAYTPAAGIKTRIGVALREVVASQHKDIYTAGKTSQVLGGAESVTDAEWQFAENMQLNSRLELFAPFKTFDQIIVRFDNTIAAKVNKYVSVTFNVQLLNDVTVSPLTQVKEVLAIGLSYQFI